MSNPRTPRQLFESFQACALRKDGASFGDLFAEDGTMEFPFVPSGAPLHFEGREAIRARASDAWGRSPFTAVEFTPIAVHDGGDPELLFAEYEVRGRVDATQTPFAVRAAMVLRAHDGLIVSMREYLDPMALAKATGVYKTSGGARPAPPSSSPREILRLYHGAMQRKSADDLANLYALDAVHEFGFFTPNRPSRYEGREAVRVGYREGWQNHPLEIDTLRDVFVYEATDPEVVVGQWQLTGRVAATHAPVALTGLLVLRVRHGLVVHARDFMDALGVANALGRIPFSPPTNTESAA
jgi:ketosteroid isomerase-like protein